MLDTIARGLAACLLIVGIPTPASAQTASPPATTIDLPEALNRTLDRNPGLRARGFEVAAADGRLLQSTFRPSPTLNGEFEDGLGTGEHRGLQAAEATVSLAWVLERGVRERIVDTARAGAAVTAVEIEIARLDAAAETARIFVLGLLFQERRRVAESGIERAREAVAAVRRRVDAGRAPEAELARAEAGLARAILRLDDFEHETLSAHHRLSAQWGMTVPDFSAVAGGLSGVPTLEAFESLLERVERNPDLAAFVSRQRLAEAELRLAEARSRPGWTVSGGLRRIERSDDWALVGGVSVPLRLGNENQGRIAETRATLAQFEAAREAERVHIETELFVIYQELRHNIELAAGLETEVAPKLEAALEDTRRAFELGRSSFLELRAVQTELLEVDYEILDAHASACLLAIEIERLTGEPLPSPPISE